MSQTNNEVSPIGGDALVLLLPCPFCGSEAEVTDESQPKRPKSWFFAWCKNRDGCNSWLADKSPEDVAKKWNTRSRAELTKMKERMIEVFASLEESQESHQGHRDAAKDEVKRMCHAGAADAFSSAKRRLRHAIWSDAEF